ncbi:MAG: FkbM family methyltransferase [Porphyrobacter sp.]|nr:FkbM family methyltransferase [Porphyrobacter sp.]
MRAWISRYIGGGWRRLERHISRAWLNGQVDGKGFAFDRYGVGHAAWWVPSDTPAGSVAYCGGVGLDATFDFALAEEKGMEVHSFDPTPGSIAYMDRENRGRVHFHPWGMLDRDEVMRFHSPANPVHANWFIDNLHGTSDYFEAPCYTIKTIMEKLGHRDIEVLKIDIEGSWGQVLTRMLENNIRPRTVCVEFDSPAPISRVRRMTKALQASGYVLARRDKENCVFILRAN